MGNLISMKKLKRDLRKVLFEIVNYGIALTKNVHNKKFVILAGPRTGGHLLIDLLNSHPQIYCEGEILHPNRVNKLFSLPLYIKGRTARIEKNVVHGFKVDINQIKRQKIEPQPFLSHLHHKNWKIIYLQRRNLLLQAISLHIAIARNQWSDTSATPLINSKFTIDSDQLIQNIQKRESCCLEEREVLAQLPHITICYDDELLKAEQHQKTADRIFEYLGVDSVPVQTNLARTSTDNLSDFLENYDEIISVLNKTKYAKFLTE